MGAGWRLPGRLGLGKSGRVREGRCPPGVWGRPGESKPGVRWGAVRCHALFSCRDPRLAGGALSPWGPGPALGRWPWVPPSLALASCCLLPLGSWFGPPHGAFLLLPNSGFTVSTRKWWVSKPPLLSTWVGRKESPKQDTRSPGAQKFLEAVFLFLILEPRALNLLVRELGPGQTTGMPRGALGLL